MKVMENPSKFNPDTQKNRKRKLGTAGRQRLCNTCHKWFALEKQPVCVRTKACRKELGITSAGPRINTGECYKGWFEHITTKPIWVESKADLYRQCVKYGKSARCLESGGEMKRPRGA